MMQKDPTSVTEVKLSLLQRLQPRFHFRHADQLVHILEIAKTEDLKPEGNVLRQSNPLMWLVLTTDILMKMRD